MHRKISLTILFISILFGSAACTENDRSIFFPLSEKIQWQYSSTMIYVRRSIESKLIQENMGGEDIDGKTVFSRVNHNGERSFFFQTNDAILLNSNAPTLDGVSADKESNFVLPINLNKGDEWRLHSRPYVMEHAIEYEVALQTSTPGIKLSKPLVMHYKVDSVDEIVDVRAGRFSQCAKIHGTGTCRMAASGGNFSGSIDVTVEHTNWYCPEVGLIKSIRTESNPSKLLDPVTYQLELEKLIKR